MNDQAIFNNVLEHGIGLNQPRQRNKIIDNGFDTTQGLANMSDSALDTLFKTIEQQNRYMNNNNQRVTINLQAKERIKALRAELTMRSLCNANMGAAELGIMITYDVDTFRLKHRLWKESKVAASSVSLPTIEVPKLTKGTWKTFNQSVIESISRVRGMNAIPLTYIIRNYLVGNYDDLYDSTEDQLINCINLSGGAFKSDNQSVFSMLVQYTKGFESETIIEKFNCSRDGRGAYTAIRSHMQSTAYMNNLRTKAMARIQSAHYKGEVKDFGIAKYFTIHSNAHNDMEISGEPLTNTMKINNFLSGMHDPTALNYAIMTRAENANHTFDEFYNSFSAKLSTHITLTKSTKPSTRKSTKFIPGEMVEEVEVDVVKAEAVAVEAVNTEVVSAVDVEEEEVDDHMVLPRNTGNHVIQVTRMKNCMVFPKTNSNGSGTLDTI